MKPCRPFWALFVLLTLLCAAPLQAQITIYVDDDAPGDPGPGDPTISDPLEDGTADHPYDAIQKGIDAAVNGDTVLVADGTYTGDGNRDIDFLGKAITVTSAGGSDSCVIDTESDYSPAHREFHFHSNEGNDSVLEGFTISNSLFGGWWDAPFLSGGGISCENASPTIRKNVFDGLGARFGGAISCNNASPLISENYMTNNASVSDVYEGSGGAISCFNASPSILDNIIDDNYAEGDGGGLYCSGGSPEIQGNRISNNMAYAGWGGGIRCISNTSALIAGNHIVGNVSPGHGPWSDGYGGGIECEGSSPVIANNLIAENHADYGAGIGCGPLSAPEISNCTLLLNTADIRGGALFCFDYGSPSMPVIVDSIIWGNASPSGDQITLGPSGHTLTIAHSDIQGGQSLIVVEGDSTLNWGSGNIDADPLFVTGPDGDYDLSQIVAGQVVDSPCLDAGLNLAAGTCWQSVDSTHCLNDLTTRTDGINDQGTADMGYHYPALNPLAAWFSCQPSSGTLPFSTRIALGIDNQMAGEFRQVAGWINVLLGNGTFYTNWRAGHLVLAPGESYARAWSQQIPGVSAVIGNNRFTFAVADVTPAPYNQPPYSPSGSTDWARCTVTGVAP
jgi:hypothetical protein